jgi:hypothetical protein
MEIYIFYKVVHIELNLFGYLGRGPFGLAGRPMVQPDRITSPSPNPLSLILTLSSPLCLLFSPSDAPVPAPPAAAQVIVGLFRRLPLAGKDPPWSPPFARCLVVASLSPTLSCETLAMAQACQRGYGGCRSRPPHLPASAYHSASPGMWSYDRSRYLLCHSSRLHRHRH